MTEYDQVDRSCYTIKLLYPQLDKINKQYSSLFHGLLEKTVEPHKMHLGLKYIGLTDSYDEEYISKLIPGLKDLSADYLPLNISFKGLAAFTSTPEWPCNPLIYLNIQPNKKLQKFHEAIVKHLKGKGDTFRLAEGKNYHPHISIGRAKPGTEEEIKKIIATTKNDREVHLISTLLGMRMGKNKTTILYDKPI